MKANYYDKETHRTPPGVNSVIVSVDFSNGVDNSVLIVGHKDGKGKIDIVNALQGVEAEEMYYRLLGKEAQWFKDEVDKLRADKEGEK